jgi:hypothetical protein
MPPLFTESPVTVLMNGPDREQGEIVYEVVDDPDPRAKSARR